MLRKRFHRRFPEDFLPYGKLHRQGRAPGADNQEREALFFIDKRALRCYDRWQDKGVL